MGEVLSLYELNHLVREVLEDSLPDTYWVTGELFEGRVGAGGHFYGELVQKDEKTHAVVAKARLNIWAGQFVRLRARFEAETGQTLRAGLKIQVLVRISFHEQFGYSLVGVDIDSSYTLGDLARQRREILQRLEAEGVLHDNQTLPLPRLLNRIAIISSDKAAGYGDFCNQLQHNDYALRFTTKLFPALMQGARTEESVLQAMMDVMAEVDRWDVLVIIRGGGATSDLADFESYALASAVAQFPIPVVVGIGHERDETVLDYVAHTRVKTPTAAAAFLVDHQKEEAMALAALEETLADVATNRLHSEQQRLDRIAMKLSLATANVRQRGEQRLTEFTHRLTSAWKLRRQSEQNKLALLEQRAKSLDPALLLQRGYSITRIGNRLLTSASDVTSGDIITTTLREGEIITQVLCHNKN